MLADDDRRQDRHHRQHARREGQQQAQAEEERRDQAHVAGRQRAGNAVAVIRAQRRSGRRLGRLSLRGSRSGCIGAPALAEQVGQAGAADLIDAFHRGIAQALVGAALRGDRQCPLAVRRRRRHRHADGHAVAVRLHLLAEGVVELDLAVREVRRAELHGGWLRRKGETLPVHVVAGRNIETHLHGVVVDLARGEAEGLLRRQEIVLRCRQGCASQAKPGQYCQQDCGNMPRTDQFARALRK
ncbi:hypothetical protein D3C81_964960 [compost metagenome]